MSPIEVVELYFRAMQGGAAEQDALFALFAEDAVYIEPFTAPGSGERHTHVGLGAIEQCIRSNNQNAPPDLKLEVNRVDVDGEVVRSEWTCTSPVFPGPVHGIDVCTVRDGKIARLEVEIP